MFGNIGKKIKGLAKAIFWIGVILSALLGFSVSPEASIITAIIGGIVSWLFTFLFYGIGQLIDDVETMVKNQEIIIGMMREKKEE